jgi:hypothetical protein
VVTGWLAWSLGYNQKKNLEVRGQRSARQTGHTLKGK